MLRHFGSFQRAFAMALILSISWSGGVRSQQEAAAQEPPDDSAGETLETVLARHYQALGGLERLLGVESLEVEGRVLTQGMEVPIKIQRKRPSFYRQTVEVQGLEMLQAYDGEEAWGVNPMAGGVKPAPLPEEQARRLVVQANFDGALVSYREGGGRLELAGRETLDGREVYRIEITTPAGSHQTSFLDAETYLEARRKVTASSNGSEIEVEISFPEYLEVDGLQRVARQVTSSPTAQMELIFDEYRSGVELADELFQRPGQEADATLELAQVMERHLAARLEPGSEAIRTVLARGKLTLMGFEVPLEMAFERPRSCRLRADLQGMEMILAFDGETAWTVSPLQGIVEPEAMPGEAADAIAIFSDFLWGLLADIESKGYEVELAGIEKVGRDETYKLVVSTAEEETRELYLGGEDFLERKLHLEAVFLGSQQEIDALLDDYRPVGGLLVPHEIRLLAGGVQQAAVKLEEVETNLELDSAIFRLPPKPEPAPDEPPR